MPRKIKKRSTFRRRGNGFTSGGDMFRRKTIKAANSRQSMKKGYVK